MRFTSKGAPRRRTVRRASALDGARSLLGTTLGQIGAGTIPAIDRLISARPRYFVHGAVALVGVVALGSVALQPRPTTQVLSAHDGPTTAEVAPAADETLSMAPVVSAPPAEEVAAATPAESPEPPKPRTHTVEEGESLRMLSAMYGVSAETILAANNISDPDLIKVGQDLVILPTNGILHKIAEGESLRTVAEGYGVNISEIVAANDLGTNPDVVSVGTELFVPGATLRNATRAGASNVARGEGVQSAAQLVPGVPVQESAPRVIPSARTYEVQPGDTLAVIAEKFGVDVDTILSTNGFDDPDLIKPGVDLRILPTRGIEYTVEPGQKLADIAWKYQVDLGLLLDYNDLDNPDMIRVGQKLMLPNGKLRADAAPAPEPAAPVVAPKPQVQTGPAGPAVAQKPAPAPAAKPQPAPKPEPAPVEAPAVAQGGGGGAEVVATAMKYRGYRYVFGGTSPAGFDCSGFVYYVHQVTGNPVGRGMWQEYNGGPKVAPGDLQPGDTVFFANTYMPGLSHNGIYIGGGQFIHASDESTGVTVSSMNSAYWSSRYVGATRLWK